MNSAHWKPFQNANPEVTALAQQPHREHRDGYCGHCESDTIRARVTPPELYPLGYRGELSAHVCLTCGNW